MTVAVENAPTPAVESEGDDEKGRKRDFTKFRPSHKELADFIAEHPEFKESGVTPPSPEQVKAVLALRSDFNDTPEQKAAREKRKAELAEEKKQFEGMTPEQVKAEKAARRAEKQAASLEAKIAEARQKAADLRSGKTATGADLAAAVESAQNGAEKPKTTISKGKPAAAAAK